MDIKGFMARNRLDILLVLALFLLAFGIRSIPSDRFPNIYGFDSFWDARMTKYMITGGWVFPFNDSITDYPYGRYPQTGYQAGYWGLSALIYKAAAAVNGISGFNYDLFGKVASWDNAILGSLAMAAIYLLGRLAFSRWVGLASALFLATSGNHLFYSIFGHAENDAFGLGLFFFALSSFVLAVKAKKYWACALSFFVYAWLLITWRVYEVAALLAAGTVLVYFLAYFILKQIGYYRDSAEKAEHRKWMLIALAFVTASALAGPLIVGETTLSVYALSGGLGALLVGSAIEYLLTRKGLYLKSMAAVGGSALAIALLLGPSVFLTPLKFMGLIPEDAQTGDFATDYGNRLIGTIAEQNPVPGGNFLGRLGYLAGSGFGITIWLAFFSVLYLAARIAIMPFLKKDFTYEWDVLALAFVFLSMWKLTEKSITMFFLSGAIAFGAGVMVGDLVKIINHFLKSNERERTYAKAGALFAIVAIGFSFNTLTINQAQGFPYDLNQEWFNTFKFLNTVPKDSVVTAWWDYGHWMNYFDGDNIRVTVDNAQDRPRSIYDVARAFTRTPPCKQDKDATISCDITKLEQAEIDSLNILRPYRTNYILIDKEIILGKFGALENIAANGIGCMLGVPAEEQNNTIVTGIRTNSGQVTFTKGEWAQMLNTTWPGTPLANIKVFARADSQGLMLYVPAFYRQTKEGYTTCDELRGDSPVLYSFAHRLFFKDPGLKHVKLVYGDGWNVIYTVDWASVPETSKPAAAKA